MSTVRTFFNNCLGDWESHRTYMYPKSNKITTLVTKFTWSNPFSNTYNVAWHSSEGQGEMNINIISKTLLRRDVGYFTNDATESIILQVDSNILRTETSYNNMIFDETIELLDHSHRRRNTIGYKDLGNNERGDIILSGSYQEFKL